MTNREKLEALRAALAEKMRDPVPFGTMVLFQVLTELIGLLLGADGPRSPLADAERADKLTLAKEAVAAGASVLDDDKPGDSEAVRITSARIAAKYALNAAGVLTAILAAEPETKGEPAADASRTRQPITVNFYGEASAARFADFRAQAMKFFQEELGERVPAAGAALQPGDVVRLRSGGPAMTVLTSGRHGTEEGWLQCMAMTSGAEVFQPPIMLPPAALIRVTDEQKAAQRERERRSILVDAERELNDVRQTIEGRPLAALQAAELAERIVALRDRITAALVEDA